MPAEMGVTKRDRPGKGWSVRFWIDGKRRERIVAPSGPEHEAEAEEIRAEIEERIEGRDLWQRATAADRLPLGVALRGWHATQEKWASERTYANNRDHIERLAAIIGELDLRELTERDARHFAELGRERWAAETVAVSLSVLRRVLNVSVRDGILPANPIPTMHELIREVRNRALEEEPEPAHWTRDEADKILAAARVSKRWRFLVAPLAIGFYTGARRGEILALRWEDIDWRRNRIRWRRAAKRDGGTKLPKAGRGRIGPMPQVLRVELERVRRERMDTTLVCAAPKGGQWAERNFARRWELFRSETFTELDVAPHKFHATRHSFITWALESGESVAIVAAWVGASARVLESNYAHVMPERHEASFLDSGAQVGPSGALESEGEA